MRTDTTRFVFMLLIAVVWLTPLGASAEADVERGEELFDLCRQCHGADGGGIQMALAPAIAGIDEWYVKAQLEKFQTGVRGMHPDDLAGLRMYPMSLAIRDEGQIAALARYVASLPPATPETTLDGDAERGEALYVTCTACHGARAEGLEALEGPALAHTSDWYLLTQLKHFKDGIRGSNPDDASGKRMRPMAMILADEQAMKDVIAYVMTLAQ
jgi:cytochrome c oxidase subunit 2